MAASLRRGSMWQFVQSAASTGTELLILLLLAARWPAETFGVLAVQLGAAKIGFLLCEVRVHEFLAPKLARYLDRHPAAALAWTRVSVRGELACNVAGFALCALVVALSRVLGLPGDAAGLLACSAYVGANTLLKFSSLAVLRCIGRVELAAGHAVVGAVLKLVVVALALHQQLPAGWLMTALALPSVLVGLSLARSARAALAARVHGRRPPPPRTLRAANLVRQRRLIVANYATGFAEIGHRELDVQILAAVAGATTAGGYRLAKTLAMVMLEALSPVVLMLLPEFSRRLVLEDRAQLAAFIRRVAAILGAVGAASAVVVGLGAGLYLGWIATSQRGVWGVVAVLLAGMAVMAPTMWAQAFLVASGLPGVYLRASLAGAALAALIAWIGARHSGALGAAIGHLAGFWIANGLAFRAAWAMLPAAPGWRR
jgi:O-antigen/teichoic acid export membrane protein